MKKMILLSLMMIALAGCSTNKLQEDYSIEKNVTAKVKQDLEQNEVTDNNGSAEERVSKNIEGNHNFNTENYIPNNAKEVKKFEFDIDGDNQSEKVLFYKSDDFITKNNVRTNQHLKVYQFQNNNWELIKEDIAANNNVEQGRFIQKVEIVNLDADNKQELLVVTQEGRKYSFLKYYIFGVHNSEYSDIPIKKVYLNYEQFLENNERGVRLTDVTLTLDGQLLTTYDFFVPWPDDTPGASWYSSEFISRNVIFTFDKSDDVYEPSIFRSTINPKQKQNVLDLNIYNDAEIGFRFHYPSSWGIKDKKLDTQVDGLSFQSKLYLELENVDDFSVRDFTIKIMVVSEEQANTPFGMIFKEDTKVIKSTKTGEEIYFIILADTCLGPQCWEADQEYTVGKEDKLFEKHWDIIVNSISALD